MLKIKALNPDNAAEIRELVRMFHKAYGDRYPVASVYDTEYWASKAGQSFLSVIAIDRRGIWAHLGVCTDTQFPTDAHVCYLASDPDLGDDSIPCLHSMWDFVGHSAEKATWRSVLCPVLEDQPVQATFAKEVLGASGVCILPEYYRFEHEEPRSINICVSLLGESRPEQTKMRIPLKYQSLAKEVFQDIGINPKLEDGGRGPRAVSADAQAVVRYNYRGWETEHLFITPTLMNNWNQLESPSSQRQVLFIDTRDPECADWCAKAESHGFVFAGFLPMFCGRHSIVFCQPLEFAIAHVSPFPRLQRLLDSQSLSAVSSSMVRDSRRKVVGA